MACGGGGSHACGTPLGSIAAPSIVGLEWRDVTWGWSIGDRHLDYAITRGTRIYKGLVIHSMTIQRVEGEDGERGVEWILGALGVHQTRDRDNGFRRRHQS